MTSFNIEKNSARKVAIGTGLAIAICAVFSTETYINKIWNGEGGPPVGIPFIFCIIALCNFYVGLKKIREEGYKIS